MIWNYCSYSSNCLVMKLAALTRQSAVQYNLQRSFDMKHYQTWNIAKHETLQDSHTWNIARYKKRLRDYQGTGPGLCIFRYVWLKRKTSLEALPYCFAAKLCCWALTWSSCIYRYLYCKWSHTCVHHPYYMVIHDRTIRS